MSKVVVSFAGKIVVLSFGDFKDELDIDSLTSIDHSNLYGEIVTASALLNRIGILKSEAESILSTKKLEHDIYVAGLQKQYRREANINAGKFTIKEGDKDTSIKLTEESLNMAILLDLAVQNKKKAIIEAQKNYSFIDALYWSVKSKDDKLSVLMKGVTPAEFADEIIEGEINGIFINKKEDTWTKNQ